MDEVMEAAGPIVPSFAPCCVCVYVVCFLRLLPADGHSMRRLLLMADAVLWAVVMSDCDCRLRTCPDESLNGRCTGTSQLRVCVCVMCYAESLCGWGNVSRRSFSAHPGCLREKKAKKKIKELLSRTPITLKDPGLGVWWVVWLSPWPPEHGDGMVYIILAAWPLEFCHISLFVFAEVRVRRRLSMFRVRLSLQREAPCAHTGGERINAHRCRTPMPPLPAAERPRSQSLELRGWAVGVKCAWRAWRSSKRALLHKNPG